MALAVPLSRFPPRVGGGPAYHVSFMDTLTKKMLILVAAGLATAMAVLSHLS
jgi:hypothetical protein